MKTLAARLTPAGTTLLVAVPSSPETCALWGRPDPPPPWVPTPWAEGVEILRTGVGKVNAAAAVARAFDPARHAGVIVVGVAGALPGQRPLRLGEIVAARSCVLADEGLATPQGFRDIAALGWPPGAFPGVHAPVEAAWLDLLAGELGAATAPIATVSTCSGTDALAAEVVRRTGAAAEGMEGAAVAQVMHALGKPCAEVRVISNTTGDRDRQTWDMPGALAALRRVGSALAGR